eukprot:CAMPEP_0113687152 /NCGR_PEP_ID=MMETSP0038_2-20120614/15750_1 /TAXON_ID=2898 /ORGANISM="Cryptomonas paramecium" /LENGTH=138 /DNA_ID=CAMNT_0000607681 /DNA_START=173 /DNA_END=586 /DNA_ORIENTATION=+ /assembly_acc=CAM_ASM_000170
MAFNIIPHCICGPRQFKDRASQPVHRKNATVLVRPVERVSTDAEAKSSQIQSQASNVDPSPLIDISGLGDGPDYDVEDEEASEEVLPKSLNDFYKGTWVVANASAAPPGFGRRSGHVVFQFVTRAHTHEVKHSPGKSG